MRNYDFGLRGVSISYLGNWMTLLVFLGILVVTGLGAGSYPAVVLSRFHPVSVLKGQAGIGGRNRFTRTLVVIQYAMSIALMISTGLMLRQLHYMRTKDLGYDREQVVVVQLWDVENPTLFSERYKNRLSRDTRIVRVARVDHTFTRGWMFTTVKKDDGESVNVRLIRTDPDYLQTLGIELLSGRNFSEAMSIDVQQSVIVNETLVKAFGLKAWVGTPLKGFRFGALKEPVIIGVVKDFHFDSLHRKIWPLILHMNPNVHGLFHIYVRIRPDDIPGTIAFLKEAWEEIAPDEPFQYSFLDENLDRQYRDEKRWSRIIGYASLFAILISCLGLLGLASLAVTRRTKEIGIRKVLGATVTHVVALLSKDFVKLVLLANLLAWPVAWYVMNRWLQNFAYRISIEWWVFALADGLALVIALVTVSTQAVRAALANPVESLRYE